MRQFVKAKMLLATTVVSTSSNSAHFQSLAVDVILLETTFWEESSRISRGLWNLLAADCRTFVGRTRYSTGDDAALGSCAAQPDFSADAHYHHPKDDILVGGKLSYDGMTWFLMVLGWCDTGPDRPQYAEAFQRKGGYPYDRDPSRPGWFALVPILLADHTLLAFL